MGDWADESNKRLAESKARIAALHPTPAPQSWWQSLLGDDTAGQAGVAQRPIQAPVDQIPVNPIGSGALEFQNDYRKKSHY